MLKPGGMVVAPVDNYLKVLKKAVQDDFTQMLYPSVSSSTILHHVRFNEIQYGDCDDETSGQLVLKCDVWNVHNHKAYSANFQQAVMYLYAIHRFGYSGLPAAAHAPAPITHSNSSSSAQQWIHAEEHPAVERIPIELWREVNFV